MGNTADLQNNTKLKKWKIMKILIQKLRKAFAIFYVRRMYVITQMESGVKYYYKGQDSQWTPMFERAKHYKKKPDFDWIGDLWYKVEEYYD